MSNKAKAKAVRNIKNAFGLDYSEAIDWFLEMTEEQRAKWAE